LTPKKLQPFITPYSPDLSLPEYFLFHFAVVAEIQEAVTDELKTIQKEEFSAAFQKLYEGAKACIYAYGTHFEYKKVRVFLMCLSFFNISPKNLDRTVYIYVFSLSHSWIAIHIKCK